MERQKKQASVSGALTGPPLSAGINKDNLLISVRAPINNPCVFRVFEVKPLRMNTRHLLAIVALSFMIIEPVMPGIYKWTDADGNIHYGDRPGDGSAEELILKDSPVQDEGLADRLKTQEKMLDIYKEERIEQQQQRDRQKEEKKLREKNCQIARERLARVRSAGFLYEKGGNGERRVFSDAERSAAEQKELSTVEQWCK